MTHIPILVETDDYLVTAKPSRLLIHPSKIAPYERVFMNKILKKQLGYFVHPVHRLDRATSGVLIWAKNKEIIPVFQEAMARETAVKRYVALCRGQVKRFDELLEIDTDIKISKGNYKSALTHARAIAHSPEPRCSLWIAWPKTGRNHQVRRHLRDLHHPVIMDSQHGDTRFNKVWKTEFGMERLGLHCLSMHIELPDHVLDVTSPIPEDFRHVLVRMPWWSEAVEKVPELDLPPLDADEG